MKRSKRRATAHVTVRSRQADVQSRWSDADAQATIKRYRNDPQVNEDVALRVYTSRLIGQDPALVLHGGGNTSVKTTFVDDIGIEVPVLCVKGSGWDLGSIEPAGLPAVRLESLGALRDRNVLCDEDMVNAQRTRLIDSTSPNPSVETLLHGFLPHKFIDHSHADAILALVDQVDAEALCREVYGDRLAVVPYVMAGFALAKLAAETYENHPDVEGLLLLKHGLFTFGDTAKESYERHIQAVDAAERFASVKTGEARVVRQDPVALEYETLAPVLRGKLCAGQRRYLLTHRRGPAIDAFVARADLTSVSQRGTATPDHVIRTKRVPLLLDIIPSMDSADIGAHIADRLASYREDYVAYVEREASRKQRRVAQLDPDPRIILVPGLGLIAAGASEKAARISADVYEHTIDVIEAAEAIGCYEALPEADLFDMEYWSLEQAKLGKASPKPLQGRVVYISGAARGIGAASAKAFAEAGASLYLTDRDASPPLRPRVRGTRWHRVERGRRTAGGHRLGFNRRAQTYFRGELLLASVPCVGGDWGPSRSRHRGLLAVQRLEGRIQPGQRLRRVRDRQGCGRRAHEAVRDRMRGYRRSEQCGQRGSDSDGTPQRKGH
jgi:rhamnose utilization protein RhaD (predicted bifunctional aldolase and dehydrogenase)